MSLEISRIEFCDSGGEPQAALHLPSDDILPSNERCITANLYQDVNGVFTFAAPATKLGRLAVGKISVVFQALVHGLQIRQPAVLADEQQEINLPCIPLEPCNEKHTYTVYLRHGDEMIAADGAVSRLQIEYQLNHDASELVQVGSSLPDGEKEEQPGFPSPSVMNRSESVSARLSKVIEDTPKVKRQHDVLGSVEDGAASNGKTIPSIFNQEPPGQEIQDSVAEDGDLITAQSPSPGLEAFAADETVTVDPRELSSVQVHGAGVEQPVLSTTTLNSIGTPRAVSKDKAADGTHDSDRLQLETGSSAEKKRKRGKMITYSASKKKRARKLSPAQIQQPEEDDDEFESLPSKVTGQEDSKVVTPRPSRLLSSGPAGSTARSKKAALSQSSAGHDTRVSATTEQPGYTGGSARVLVSNSTILDKTAIAKFLLSQGGKRVNRVGQAFDILIVGTGELKKRSKLLMAVALGMPIVTERWLEESARAGRLLDLQDFTPSDPQREKEWGWTAGNGPIDTTAAESRSRKSVLAGKSVYFTPALKREYGADYKDIEEVAKAAGAREVLSKPTRSIPDNEDEGVGGGDGVIILGKAVDEDIDAAKLVADGRTCFGKDFLSLSILRGELQTSRAFQIQSTGSSHGESSEAGVAMGVGRTGRTACTDVEASKVGVGKVEKVEETKDVEEITEAKKGKKRLARTRERGRRS